MARPDERCVVGATWRARDARWSTGHGRAQEIEMHCQTVATLIGAVLGATLDSGRSAQPTRTRTRSGGKPGALPRGSLVESDENVRDSSVASPPAPLMIK